MNNIIAIIIWAALIHGFLLGVFFILNPNRRTTANKILGALLLVFIFEALTDILPYNFIGSYSIGGYFTLPEVKMLFPVLMLQFILAKLGKVKVYKLFLKVHYIVAFIAIFITFINTFLFLIIQRTILDLFGWTFVENTFMIYQHYAFFLSIVVFIIGIKEIINYKKLVQNERSDIMLLNIKWLWQFVFALAPVIIFWGSELLRIALGGLGQSEFTTFAFIFIAVFIYFVSFKAFTHQTLFDDSETEVLRIPPSLDDSEPINSENDLAIYSIIQDKMKEGASYLIKNLTIHDFAKEIKISSRSISSCINKNSGINFNEWVNNFRVEKALEIMKDNNSLNLSIEGIGFESGFKSRSAMYAAFKRKFGKSPGHFRE